MSLGRDKVLWLFLYSALVRSVTLGRRLALLVGRWMPRSHHPGALRHPSSSKEGNTTTLALRATAPYRRRDSNAGASRHRSSSKEGKNNAAAARHHRSQLNFNPTALASAMLFAISFLISAANSAGVRGIG